MADRSLTGRQRGESSSSCWRLLAMGLFCLLIGCSQSATITPRLAGGVITIDGEPLTAGTVTFHGQDGQQVTAAITPKGAYSVQLPAAGEYLVALAGDGIPGKYADSQESGLSIVVEMDAPPLMADFELKR